MTGWRDRRTAPEDGTANSAGAANGGGAGGGGAGGKAAARLRAMVPADLVGVLALEHELFPDDPWTAGMFAGELAEPPESRLYLLAEVGAAGGLVMAGYAGMMFIPGGTQADV